MVAQAGDGGNGGAGGVGGAGGTGGIGGAGGLGNSETANFTAHYIYAIGELNEKYHDNVQYSHQQQQAAKGDDGVAGAADTAGIQGAGGNGGEAQAVGILFVNSNVLLNVDNISAYARAGSAGSGSVNGTNGASALAIAYQQFGGTVVSTSNDTLTIEAQATNASIYNAACGIELVNGNLSMSAAGNINIAATTASVPETNNIMLNQAYGIYTENATLDMKSADGAITIMTNGTSNSTNFSVLAENSTLSFDSGTNSTNFIGNSVILDSTLNLKSNTNVQDNDNNNDGSLNLAGTTVNLTNNLQTLAITGDVTLSGSTLYFYDKNNVVDTYDTTTGYRTILAGGNLTEGDNVNNANTLYMRTNAMGAYGGTAQTGDVIQVNGTASGTYDIHVFDEGMRNGYNNISYNGNFLQTNAEVVNTVDLITSTEGSQTTTGTTQTQYDNAVWNYTYDVTTQTTGGVTQLVSVSANTVKASNAQYTARDANKAAAAAITLFGSDETVTDHLRDIRSGKKEEGVWAQYTGGKVAFDDASFKYNGLAVGYDHKVGEWQIGFMGSYAKGDTDLANGDGTVKATAGGVYGTWQNGKGHYLDLLAKIGKVSSDSTSYGGTIPQSLTGDFSSTAIGVSAQYGYRKQLKNDTFIEPMIRASYVHLGGDDYSVVTRDNTMSVSNDGFNTFQLRGGVLIGKNLGNDSNVYAKFAVLHHFGGSVDTHIYADGRTNYFSDDISGTGFEYGIGTNYKLNKKSTIYADIERISGGSITRTWGINAGYKYVF